MCCWINIGTVFADVSTIDDDGNSIALVSVANRVVSLAPHATEILFAIGAGNKIVGVVDYSDYPPAAQTIPRVGGYNAVDIETILAMNPDLIIAWKTGNNQSQLDKLRTLGFTLFINEPRYILDIPETASRLAILTGTEDQAKHFVQRFNEQYAYLKATYSEQTRVKLFYEIWNQPLMTISGEHLISDVMRLCGAENVFADVTTLAPTVSVEAVLAAAPELIVAGGMEEQRHDWLDEWRRWPQLPAVRNSQLYFINPDLIQRHGPRILTGAEQLCRYVDMARRANQ